MLQKTQAVEAEMRAAIGLVDEYGREGWELGKKYYYEAGKDVEFDAINLDRGIIAEAKSNIPQYSKVGKLTLGGWIKSKVFEKKFVIPGAKAILRNGLNARELILYLPKDLIVGENLRSIEEEIENLFERYGVSIDAKIEGFEWR